MNHKFSQSLVLVLLFASNRRSLVAPFGAGLFLSALLSAKVVRANC
jgi:hypothetical protein